VALVGEPTSLNRGRGSQSGCWVWSRAICGGEGRGGGGRMRENGRKSTVMGLMAD
jgi:hypothetical protein